MTRINKVVLAGFKSFQKRTVIPFFDGLTAIVGENGAGKSNLFDAISFVMGRRSSQLRADRLEHLIFNGGERHAPSEEAEVVLHLDNTGGVFNRFLENGDRAPEVTIGRRITRKSSTYLFMGKGCPRELVDQVLEEARVDPDGQQLIAQGRITDVVRRSPLKRREILDEVSGIAAYDDRRRQAIDELKDVKSKLNTHRVVLAERRRRLVALERERDAALEHQRLTEEQGHLADSIRHLKRERVVERLARARAERGGMVGQTEGLEEEVKRLDLAIENKEWELEGMRDEAGGPGEVTLVKEVERVRAGIAQKGMEMDLKRQQAKSLQEMIDEVARMKAAEATRAAAAPTASRAVQALLARKRGGIYGTVASLATPRSGFEVAFETAAGGSLSDLVVDSRETALECIAYLKENRLGRVRVLPLGRLVTPHKSVASADALKLAGVVDYAINLVDFDPKYRRAFEYVLTDTVVAETLEAVRDVDGVRVVTLDGDLQSKGGALTGGSRPESAREPIKPRDAAFDTARKRQEVLKLGREVERLEEEVVELRALLAEKEGALREQEAKGSEAKGQATARSEELRVLREARRETYQRLEGIRRNLVRYERDEAEAQAELEALGAEDHPADHYIPGPVVDLERRIEENKRRLRRLEPVNMRAIEDYAAFEAEFNLFRDKVNALEDEKREIERLIGEIEERKRERFLETLSEVKTHFDRIFRELFEGGSASLELEEEGNISSGLLVKANPPEKEPHVLDSLSGGEQTLVATAFVFALQEHQQAPFFILDEIDAALDLLNATRLARMLREYAKRAQVIVVSHNEETVRHADRAYGVTMHGGVSQVLALNLN
jgi:chromosome segregation protein